MQSLNRHQVNALVEQVKSTFKASVTDVIHRHVTIATLQAETNEIIPTVGNISPEI